MSQQATPRIPIPKVTPDDIEQAHRRALINRQKNQQEFVIPAIKHILECAQKGEDATKLLILLCHTLLGDAENELRSWGHPISKIEQRHDLESENPKKKGRR